VTKFEIEDTITFRYPPVIKKMFSIVDLKAIYYNSDTLGFSCNLNFNVNEEELDQAFEDYINEALSEEE
jgi:hypothetical protein